MLREKTACWGSHTASAAAAKGVAFRPAQSAYDFDADLCNYVPRLRTGFLSFMLDINKIPLVPN
jgi:hypothetical protein